MKIDSVALSEIPELMHDFLQDSRGQSFGELEERWEEVVTEPDADEDDAYEIAMLRIDKGGFEPDETEVTEIKEN